EEEVELPVEVVAADLARGEAVAPRVDPLRGEAERAELGDLVLHQRDQGRDDERRAGAGEAGELVAERFAGSRRHDEERVLPGRHGAADGLLVRPERCVAEHALEELAETFGRYRRARDPRLWLQRIDI